MVIWPEIERADMFSEPVPEHAGYWTPDAPNASFEALDPATADADLAAYRESVARARRAVTQLDLDALCPCSECADQPRSPRWVYTPHRGGPR